LGAIVGREGKWKRNVREGATSGELEPEEDDDGTEERESSRVVVHYYALILII